MKTEIQNELHQFMIPHLKGKEHSEQMKLIAEMQEYLEGIKNALIADSTLVRCDICKNQTKASKWETEEHVLNYEKNQNKDYNEDDEWIQIISVGTYGICPICNRQKLIHEKVLRQIPLKKGI